MLLPLSYTAVGWSDCISMFFIREGTARDHTEIRDLEVVGVTKTNLLNRLKMIGF